MSERGKQVKEATRVALCAEHRDSLKRDRGWQDRQRAARAAQRKRLKALTREQSLFDVGSERPIVR